MMYSPNQKERIDWIDAAKGIGMLLVVYGHVARGLANSGIYKNLSFNLIDSLIYSFHMPLFFFLSGLFFMKSFQKRGLSLVFNKFDTLYYSYLIWSVVQSLLEVGLSQYTNGELDLKSLLTIIWQPRAQFWFLYTLFFLFIFNIIIAWFLSKSKRIKNIIPPILLLISFILLIFKSYFPNLFIIQSLISFDIYFCVGIYLFAKQKLDFDIFSLAGLLMLFAIGEYFYSVLYNFEHIRYLTLSMLIAFTGIFTVIAISQHLPSSQKQLFSFIGHYSMEIFLMHVIFASGIRIILQKILHINQFEIHIVIGTLVGIMMPILIAKMLCEKKVYFVTTMPTSFSSEKLVLESNKKINSR